MTTAETFCGRAWAPILLALVLGLLLLGPRPAAAQTRHVTATLPDYSGPGVPSAPFPNLTIGTFTYTLLPGESVLRATVRGTWGNDIYPPGSAGANVFVDGVLVAQCVRLGTCWLDTPPDRVPWSFAFSASQFPLLNDGQAVLTAQQTSDTFVELGDLTLDLELNSPPVLSVTGAGTGDRHRDDAGGRGAYHQLHD